MSFPLLLYITLPAFVANMTPVLAEKLALLPSLNIPIDGGRKLFGKRIFGDHKTLRGFIVGSGSGILVAFCQFLLQWNGIIPFSLRLTLPEFLLFGLLSGFGALMGDAIESFFKRQIGIASGHPFLPFDQIDYILGFLLATSFLISWTLSQIIFLLLCGLIFNPLANLIAFLLGIKKTYW